MTGSLRAFLTMVIIAFGIMNVAPAAASTLQCVPFAREVSGIELYGNAHTWWHQAEGRYSRGHEPREGAVLTFARSRAMPVGHVAMVSKVVNDREVLLTHANWSYRGGIEKNVRAIDVSPNNDWTDVRVWYGPTGAVGIRANPAFGFIYPGDEHKAPSLVAGVRSARLQLDLSSLVDAS